RIEQRLELAREENEIARRDLAVEKGQRPGPGPGSAVRLQADRYEPHAVDALDRLVQVGSFEEPGLSLSRQASRPVAKRGHGLLPDREDGLIRILGMDVLARDPDHLGE